MNYPTAALAWLFITVAATCANAHQQQRGDTESAESSRPPVQSEELRPTEATDTTVAGRSFADWLEDVRSEALALGIRAETIDSAFKDIEPLAVVIERDRAQAEQVLPPDEYLARRLRPAFIATARRQSARHAALLERVANQYGVSSAILVSVWGLETNFGRFSGVRPTIAALATLAYDTRRPGLFREELFAALRILDSGDIDLAAMKGSWAGAMGQPQFMPSSYIGYAEDFDGDGRRDIWRSVPDVFASIANYLKGHGWLPGERWGREVRVSKDVATRIAGIATRQSGSCAAARQMSEWLPLSRWQELGVRLTGGGALPKAERDASLVVAGRRSFLVYANYDALLAYNCAHAYALSVGLLADRTAGR